MFVPNLKILGAVVPEKSVTKVWLEKKINDAKSYLHDTSSRTQCLFQISKS